MIRRVINSLSYRLLPLRLRLDFIFIRLRLVLLKLKTQKPLIAIALVDYMGDIIAAEPIIRQVRKMHPNGYILWFVKKEFADLVNYHPDLNGVIKVRCLKTWVDVQKSFHFDHIYDLHINHKYDEITRTFYDRTYASPISFDNYYRHGNLLAIFCQVAGMDVIDGQPAMHIPGGVFSALQKFNLPEHYITIHADSKDESRNWKAESWKLLVQSITERLQIPVVAVGFKQDFEYESKLYINLCGKTSLLETAAVIKNSGLFIGIDSGPAHMANAVGTYGIILLGNFKQVENYMPYSGNYKNGGNAKMIRAKDGVIQSISVEEVYDEVLKRNVNHLMPNA